MAADLNAKLRVVWIDPWSATKMAFLVGALHAATMAALTIAGWSFADRAGIIDAIGRLVDNIGGSAVADQIRDLDLGHVVQFVGALAGLDVAVFTCAGALAAGLFNLATHIVGGWKIRLAMHSTSPARTKPAADSNSHAP